MPEPLILKVVGGKDAGRQITVPIGGAVLGRGLDCDIVLDEPSVSRKHCRIVSEKADWIIEDLDSRSGVIINGQASSENPLKQGDEIKLAALVLKVVSLQLPQGAPARDAISFSCKCGKVHVVKAAFAGKSIVCKQCRAKIVIPAASLPKTAPSPAPPLPGVEALARDFASRIPLWAAASSLDGWAAAVDARECDRESGLRELPFARRAGVETGAEADTSGVKAGFAAK